jgi:endonuclease/exonuclease/phosphatase family metal-dependent hydrolase
MSAVSGTIASLIAVCFLVAPAWSQQSEVLSVLSYNVQGLPPMATKGDPGRRADTIGWLANKYDVVLFQEDFEYYGAIGSQMRRRTRIRGNGMGWDPRRVAAKVFLAPFGLLLPHFWPPYGSGLTTYARPELLLPGDRDAIPYDVCNDWLGGTADCWASKGYLRVGARPADGGLIDVYNTHLEAGTRDGSLEARRKQLAILARAIRERSAGRAVIVGGDFNLGFSRPGDREAMMDFRREAGLEDSGAGPELPLWRERDYILFRSSADLTLRVEAMGEATEFVNEDLALSDHPAIYARFRVEPSSPSEAAR